MDVHFFPGDWPGRPFAEMQLVGGMGFPAIFQALPRAFFVFVPMVVPVAGPKG